MNKLASTLIWCMICSVLFFSAVGKNGFPELLRMTDQVEYLKRQKFQIESDIVRLEDQIDSLQADEYLLEKKARQDLALSKPGDIVYIFPKGSTQLKSDQQSEIKQ